MVRSEVNALGPHRNPRPKRQGASFRMLPLLTTAAVTQVVMLRWAIWPSVSLEKSFAAALGPLISSRYRTGVFETAGESPPFFWCGALLQASQHSIETAVGQDPSRGDLAQRGAAHRHACG